MSPSRQLGLAAHDSISTYRVVPERDGNDEVQEHEHESLHPAAGQHVTYYGQGTENEWRWTHFDLPSERVWLTINTDKNSTIDSYAVGEQCRHKADSAQRTVKQQGHGLANRPSQELDDRDDEQRDLNRRADLIISIKAHHSTSSLTATEIDRSSLSLTETDTAVKCSAALPTWRQRNATCDNDNSALWPLSRVCCSLTIGSRIRPTHSWDKLG